MAEISEKHSENRQGWRARRRGLIDTFAGYFTLHAAVATVLLVIVFSIGLYAKARPILHEKSFGSLFLSSAWSPAAGSFGFLPFIMGTLWVTVIAMLISTPLSFLTAVYLSEYAPRWIRSAVRPFIDLLAGIPSVVFGVWGVLVVVPIIRDATHRFSGNSSTGYSVLAGGIVLAFMVIPVMVSVMQEVLSATPSGLREVSFSLGATRWETVKYVVCRHSAAGLTAACILALSRAFGETMAVLMVVGNTPIIPRSVLDSGYPLPALIANNYGEMMSVKLYDSALMTAALLLMLVVLASHVVAKLVVKRMSSSGGAA